MCSPKDRGGLGLPHLRLYHVSCHIQIWLGDMVSQGKVTFGSIYKLGAISHKALSKDRNPITDFLRLPMYTWSQTDPVKGHCGCRFENQQPQRPFTGSVWELFCNSCDSLRTEWQKDLGCIVTTWLNSTWQKRETTHSLRIMHNILINQRK